ncbi:MAG: hypothetical protein Kow0098_02730 [Ignavibacteriaceae bacterium]
MHRLKHYSFLILSVLILVLLAEGCKTNPPDSPEIIIKPTGKIYVTSNIPGAEIYLDSQFTGSYTPDTISAEAGLRIIRLEKENYFPVELQVEVQADSTISADLTLIPGAINKVVILEDFANVSCVPCVISNSILKSLKSYTYDESELIIIKFPTNFPAGNDPFYLANTTDCDSRMDFYNINAAPTTIVDGILKPISTDSISIKAAIEERLNAPADFIINISDTIISNEIMINISTVIPDVSGIDFSNLVLHTVLIEGYISFSFPPGGNGETEFYDVMRVMLPDNSGESLSFITASGSYDFERTTEINPDWQQNELRSVAYIQNIQTKEILQAGISE